MQREGERRAFAKLNLTLPSFVIPSRSSFIAQDEEACLIVEVVVVWEEEIVEDVVEDSEEEEGEDLQVGGEDRVEDVEEGLVDRRGRMSFF